MIHITLAELIRDDFKNIFMAEAGEPFRVIRDGQFSHEVDAIPGKDMLQLCLDTDVTEGDILEGILSNKRFIIISIEYEIVERERTTIIAHCK